MTITVVQSKNINGAWTGSFGSNVTAGNTVFLIAFSYNGTAMSSSSPLFNGSSVTGASQLYGLQSDNTGVYTTAWMLPNVSGGAASVGLTTVNGVVDGNVGMAAVEVSGLNASPSLDSGASPNPSTGFNAAGTGTVSSGSTGNITSAPEFIVASGVIYGQNPGTPSPWTTLQPSGFCTAAWQVVTSSGSGYVFTGNAATNVWCAGVAAIQPSGGAAATATPAPLVVPSLAAVQAATW